MIQARSTVQTWWTQPETKTVFWLLVGGLLLRGTIALWLPPGFDEAYYYLYTRNLSWSYFDHPLLVALTTGLGVWLTGEVSPFTIRLGSLLLYTGSLILLYLTSVRLFSIKAAVLTVAIASLIPIFFVSFGVLTLPDSPLIFFWSATLYVAAEEFFRQPNYRPSYRLAGIGCLVGLACLSKYHGLALGFGLIGFCSTSSRHRVALRSPWLLLAVGLCLLCLLPIVLWNAQHDWISLRYQSGRAIPDRGYSLLELLGVFGVGVAYLFPTFGLPLWWVSLRTLGQSQTVNQSSANRHPLTFNSQPSALILWLSLPLMLGFTLMGGYRPVLPTWAMPGFWGATLLLGNGAANWQARSPTVVRRWLWGSGLTIVALILVALLHLSLGTLQKPSRYAWFGGLVPVSSDASVQLVDIQQIRHGVQASPVLMAALSRTNFIFTNEIFLAGQVGMGLAPLTSAPITCFSDDPRGFAYWSTASEWLGQNGLYLTSSRQPNADKYRSYFRRVDQVGEVALRRGGTVVEIIQVYECRELLKAYPRPYGAEATANV